MLHEMQTRAGACLSAPRRSTEHLLRARHRATAGGNGGVCSGESRAGALQRRQESQPQFRFVMLVFALIPRLQAAFERLAL